MPMKRHLYPVDWEQIAGAVKDAADWQCQQCGRQCRRPGEPFDTHRRTLTVAHWDHDTQAAAVFLVALCAPCHLRHDAQRKVGARKDRNALALLGIDDSTVYTVE